MRIAMVCGLLSLMPVNPLSAQAVNFYFSPDSTFGQVGDTVLLSGMIAPSDTMRGFVVYLGYDTMKVKFVTAQAGSLVAGRTGLQFYFYDHIPIFPDQLDIGATVYSTDYWAGPGELFRAWFVLRGCGDEPIVDRWPPDFRAPDGTSLPATFDSGLFLVCDRVPQSPLGLTIHAVSSDLLQFRWNAVTCDTLGRTLLTSPQYLVYQQQVLPEFLPPELVNTVMDTEYVMTVPGSMECVYFVTSQTP